jgi:hypothetical protein
MSYTRFFHRIKEAATEPYFVKYLQHIPNDVVLKDAISYWHNRKVLWNKKQINLTHGEVKEIVNFQSALQKVLPEWAKVMEYLPSKVLSMKDVSK